MQVDEWRSLMARIDLLYLPGYLPGEQMFRSYRKLGAVMVLTTKTVFYQS